MSQRAKWTESFQQASDRISEWRGQHPRASFSEIEHTVDAELAKVRVALIQDLALESAMTDLKQLAPAQRPQCPRCGRALRANGKDSRQLITTYDQVVELERSKGYCRHCGVSFFPPG